MRGIAQILIEITFSDKLESNVIKEKKTVDKFLGELIAVYRSEIDKMILPLKAVDPKVKVKVFRSG
jgi:hypothetical protein